MAPGHSRSSITIWKARARTSCWAGLIHRFRTWFSPTSNAVILTGLTADALYHFRARSRDAAGNLNVSADFTLITHSSPGAGGVPQAVIWTNTVNATSTGATLKKTAGCDGCASTAVSQQVITSGNGYAANATDAHMPPIRPTCRRSTCHACAGVGCATERSEAMADKRNACAVVGQAPAGCEGETPLASCLRGRRLGVQKT